MRILVLIHEFPPIGGGGGRVAEDLCRELAGRGHEIRVLTAHLGRLPFEEQRDGFHIYRLRSFRKEPYRASLGSMFIYILTGLWAGLRLIKRWRPDVIHVHFAVPAGPLAWMLSHLTGIPYLLTTHLGDVPDGVPDKTNEWFRFIYPFTPGIWKDAKKVVAVSKYTRQLAEKYYPVQIEVIPNGIDLRLLAEGNLQVHNPPRLMFAGRFMPQKNPLQVVRTLAEIKDLDWECVMLGDGPLLDQVKKGIAEHGMKDRFTLPGWVTPSEVLAWFDKGDVLFMPSLSEGLPVVGVQALVKGLAIVASRVGGFVDLVVDEENGYLFELNDDMAMASALRSLLTDSDKLLCARSRSRELAQQFDITSIAGAYENALTELVHR